MLVRLYDNTEIEQNFGIISEGANAGKISYIESPEIKELFLNGENGIWAPNPGYNPNAFLAPVILNQERNICQKTLLQEKAAAIGYTDLSTVLTAEILMDKNKLIELQSYLI